MDVQAVIAGDATAVALLTKSQTGGKFNSDGYGVSRNRKRDFKRSDKKCTHCAGIGHTKETCFKIHGYPNGSNSKRIKEAAIQGHMQM